MQKSTKIPKEKRKTKQRTILHVRWFGFYQYRGAGGKMRPGRPRLKNKTHQHEWTGVSKKLGKKKKKKKKKALSQISQGRSFDACILHPALCPYQHALHMVVLSIILCYCFCPCSSSVFLGRCFLSGEPASESWQTI